ncbi:MAG: kelch repeat-containing protein [candidate division WOR-3 bacterium]
MNRYAVILCLLIGATLALDLSASDADTRTGNRLMGKGTKSATQPGNDGGAFGMVWTSRQSSPPPGRYWCPGTGVVRDTVYFLGGRIDYGGGNTNSTRTIWAYVPATNSWITTGLPTLLVPRRAGGGGRIGNKIYVAGGRDSTHTTLNTCEEFDVDTKTVTSKASMPGAGCWACASAVAGNKLYIIGDENNSGNTYEYDPAANQWYTKASLPAGRGWAAAAGAQGRVYVFGGSDAAGNTLSDCWEFNPANNTWTQKAAMPGPRIYHSAVTYNDTLIFVIGGANDGAGYSDSLVYCYHVPSNTWRIMTPMPTSRGWLMANQVGDAIYASLGSDCSTPTYLTVNEMARFLQHDVGVARLSPANRTPPNQRAVFRMLVKNYGEANEDFTVRMVVYDSIAGNNVIEDEKPVTGLGPGDSLWVVFDSLTPVTGNVYLVTASVTLTGDENPANDTLRTRVEVRLGSDPDGFGYIYESTQEPGDTVRFFWIDPTAGTPVTDWSPNADDGYSVRSLPFTFRYYDQYLNTINICTNGFLETSTLTNFSNTSFPTAITNHIAGWWDDLDLRSAGTVYQYNDPAGQYVVFAWVNVPRYNAPAETQTFEIVLYPNGVIRYNYLSMNGTLNSSTVGIQGLNGSNNWYHQYLYNGVPAHHIVDDSVAIIFYYPPYLGTEETTSPAVSVSKLPSILAGRELKLPAEFHHGRVTIYDVHGGVVKTVECARRLNLKHLPAGVYVVQLENGTTVSTRKLILMK